MFEKGDIVKIKKTAGIYKAYGHTNYIIENSDMVTCNPIGGEHFGQLHYFELKDIEYATPIIDRIITNLETLEKKYEKA